MSQNANPASREQVALELMQFVHAIVDAQASNHREELAQQGKVQLNTPSHRTEDGILKLYARCLVTVQGGNV